MDVKNFVIAATLLALLLLYLRYKKRMAIPFTLAFLVSLSWSLYYRYEYMGDNIFIFDQINLYPLALWSTGLTALYFLYLKIRKPYQLIKTTVIYLALLAIVEYIGYHLLGIRLNSNFTSLLGLGVIHAPLIMKIFYVLAGPIYLQALQFYLNYNPRPFSKR